MKDEGPRLGYQDFADQIQENGGEFFVSDPATRQQILDLRFNPEVSPTLPPRSRATMAIISTENSGACRAQASFILPISWVVVALNDSSSSACRIPTPTRPPHFRDPQPPTPLSFMTMGARAPFEKSIRFSWRAMAAGPLMQHLLRNRWRLSRPCLRDMRSTRGRSSRPAYRLRRSQGRGAVALLASLGDEPAGAPAGAAGPALAGRGTALSHERARHVPDHLQPGRHRRAAAAVHDQGLHRGRRQAQGRLPDLGADHDRHDAAREGAAGEAPTSPPSRRCAWARRRSPSR